MDWIIFYIVLAGIIVLLTSIFEAINLKQVEDYGYVDNSQWAARCQKIRRWALAWPVMAVWYAVFGVKRYALWRRAQHKKAYEILERYT